MLSDLTYAFRQLAKSPGFTFVAVLSLALGIGVNATMFGFVKSVVLEPMIRNRHERLVSLYSVRQGANRNFRHFTYLEFNALRESHEVFSDVAAVAYGKAIVGRKGDFKRVLVGLVSENYFPLLRAQPVKGRFFSADETRAGAEIPVAVATYSLWQRMGQPGDFVGSQIQINHRPYTVIGIAPRGGGDLASVGPVLWLPIGMARQIWGDRTTPADFLNNAKAYAFSLIGSFQTGVSFGNAHDRLAALDRRLNAPPLGDASAPHELVLAPPPSTDIDEESPPNEGFLVPFALIAMALAANVLIVASLNLANMVMARGAARQKEIAVRLSLGASRWRIVRQLLTESALLALAGSLVGLLLSHVSGIYLSRAFVTDMAATQFDPSQTHTYGLEEVVMFAALCFGSVAIFGLGPALRISRVNLVDDLKRQPGQPSEGGRWNRFFSPRHCRMMMQIALSFMLLFSAGLIVSGARKAIDLDPGFKKAGELVVNVAYVDPDLTDAAIARREQAMLVRAAALPGVADAALALSVPFNFETWFLQVFPTGTATASLNAADQTTHAAPSGVFSVVSRGYFKTLGIPLLRGRDFTEAESTKAGGHQVAIIDETLARTLFGDKDPIGRHLTTNAADADGKHPDREIEIVGIIRSPYDEVFEATGPHRFYRPLGQLGQWQWPRSNIYLHVRVSDPSAAPQMLDRLRRELTSLDPDNPVLLAQPLGDFIDKNVNLDVIRMAGMVFGASGVIALLLVVIGVYGVKAHAVVRRTREIGIRIALGAKPSDILALIIKQGVQQMLVGLAAGMVLALLAGRILTRMLYHVSPLDPLVLASAAAALACTVLFACWLPARRATKVDPAVTLRAE